MKIAMIGPFGLTIKSTMRERALPMAKALVRRGHQVTLIVPPWDDPAEAGQHWVEEGVHIINSQLPRHKGPLFHIQLTALLVRLAMATRPDVVHLFKPKAYAGLAHTLLLALRSLRRHQARLVVDEDDWETAWNEKGDYSRAQKHLFAWQEPWGLRQADSITVASRALERLVEGLNISRYKVFYVPNGTRPLKSAPDIWKVFPAWQEQLSGEASAVAGNEAYLEPRWTSPILGRFANEFVLADFAGKIRAEYDLLGKPIVLLYTRFFEFRLTFLMEVIARVNQFLPEARWLVVGHGYWGEENRLKQMAQAQGLAGKLIFTGWVPQESLADYFSAANAAIYPYDDTLLNRTKCSIKLLDLLSAGVPVVASRVGQNIEYINHGRTGLLVPPHNVEAMAEALLLILNHRHLQRTLSHEAARHINRVFHWDYLVEGVEAAYQGA